MNEIRKSLWLKFRSLLKADTVRLYVWPYYIVTLAWGIYATFLATPNSTIETFMGSGTYDLWTWSCIWAPAFVMFGMLIPWIFKKLLPRPKAMWASEAIQVGGNTGVGMVLLSLEYALVSAIPWGTASPLIFFIAPYVLGCSFLAMRNALELYEAEWDKS